MNGRGAGQDSVRDFKPKGNLATFLSTIRIDSVKGEGTGCQGMDVRSFHLIYYTFLFNIIGWILALVLWVIVKESVFSFGQQSNFSFPLFSISRSTFADSRDSEWWKLFSQNFVGGIYLFLYFVNHFHTSRLTNTVITCFPPITTNLHSSFFVKDTAAALFWIFLEARLKCVCIMSQPPSLVT